MDTMPRPSAAKRLRLLKFLHLVIFIEETKVSRGKQLYEKLSNEVECSQLVGLL
jgi:hypothetical protein